jgi:hypothetical protein
MRLIVFFPFPDECGWVCKALLGHIIKLKWGPISSETFSFTPYYSISFFPCLLRFVGTFQDAPKATSSTLLAPLLHKGSAASSSPVSLTTHAKTSYRHMSSRHPRGNCWSKVLGVPRFLLWILLALTLIVIVVPLAVMFGKKKSSPPQSTVLVPLYVYPNPGAWDPLFTA